MPRRWSIAASMTRRPRWSTGPRSCWCDGWSNSGAHPPSRQIRRSISAGLSGAPRQARRSTAWPSIGKSAATCSQTVPASVARPASYAKAVRRAPSSRSTHWSSASPSIARGTRRAAMARPISAPSSIRVTNSWTCSSENSPFSSGFGMSATIPSHSRKRSSRPTCSRTTVMRYAPRVASCEAAPRSSRGTPSVSRCDRPRVAHRSRLTVSALRFYAGAAGAQA